MTKEVKDKTWGEVFWQWLVILFWIWLVLKLIPKVFNYIVFGKESNNSDLDKPEPPYKSMVEFLDEVTKK